MEHEGPNWVSERAKCNMDRLFRALCALVKCNVDRMNKEAHTQDWPIQCVYRPPIQDVQECTVERLGPGTDPTGCQFEYNSKMDHIVVRLMDRTCIIRTHWDGENARCQLVVDSSIDGLKGEEEERHVEFPHDHLWKVVQYILEPFFFSKQADWNTVHFP